MIYIVFIIFIIAVTVFIVNFEQMSHNFLVFQFLTLKM